MNWHDHSGLEGHALLAPSGYSWLNYSDTDHYSQLFKRMKSNYATEIGTIVHAYAKDRITYGFPLMEDSYYDVLMNLLKAGIPEYAIDINLFYDILCEYVNDAIELKLRPEQPLFYSDNCFGTADTIGYSRRKLKIHDLKTGANPAKFEQLEIYAALFFLEYGKELRIKPETVETELRIYQAGEVGIYNPSPEEIHRIIDKIIELDNVTDIFKSGGKV